MMRRLHPGLARFELQSFGLNELKIALCDSLPQEEFPGTKENKSRATDYTEDTDKNGN
jgi:hypothetical protein